MVGILWHSVAAGDSWAIGRLPLLVPVMVQLLAVSTDVPFAVGCSLISGVEVFARLVVHPVSATMVVSSLSAWNGLLARSAVVGLGEGVKYWCVIDIGSLNVTVLLFIFPQRLHWGIKWQLVLHPFIWLVTVASLWCPSFGFLQVALV